MTKDDIIRKLTSRKLWAAIALFVSGLLTATGRQSQAETISGLIMQGAAVLAYILAEGLSDAKGAGADVYVNQYTEPTFIDDDIEE